MLFQNSTVLVDEVFDDSKWMNLDFWSSNFNAFWSAYENTFYTISVSNLQFICTFRFDCDSNIVNKAWHFNVCVFMFIFYSENKNQKNIENKMSKIDGLCEISVRIVWTACFFHRMLIRFFDQSWMIWFAIFNLCKITINRFVETW